MGSKPKRMGRPNLIFFFFDGELNDLVTIAAKRGIDALLYNRKPYLCLGKVYEGLRDLNRLS